MTQFTFPLPVKPGDKQVWGDAQGAALSLAVADAAQRHAGFSLIITPDQEQAERLRRELDFFIDPTQQLDLLTYPDWETLPYDTFSPHQDIISQRLHTLHKLPRASRGILIVAASTLMHKTPPTSFLEGNSLVLATGDAFDREKQRHILESAGYHCVDTVYEHGDYAMRGSIIDIFPMGSNTPFRIDLFDDEIDTLRTFDPETQRSIEQVERIHLLPAREYPQTSDAISHFKQAFRSRFDVDYRECPLYLDLSRGLASPGAEYYLSLFFKETASLFDYLPDNTLLITTGDIQPAVTHFRDDLNSRYENRKVDPSRPILPPAEIFLADEELFRQCKSFPRIQLEDEPVTNKAGHYDLPVRAVPVVEIDHKSSEPLTALQGLMCDASRVLLCAESAGRRENLTELLSRHGIAPAATTGWHDFLSSDASLAITTAPIDSALWLDKDNTLLLTETQLLGGQVMQRRRRKRATDETDLAIRNLGELSLGAPVVHLDHGIGRYRGLQTIDLNNQPQEFLTIEYTDEAKLYVPVSSLHLVSRYSGADDQLAPISRLGTEQWSKARQKAAEKARDAAAELLDIYARREAQSGFACTDPGSDYQIFASAFPFEETPDQEVSIQAVVRDMMADRPMDRLICGDVGFGKTEVAMRAAFMAVHNSRQVAVLVPTTLLAQQHFESFRDRFADWPVKVEVMSRFKTAKQISELKNGLAEGSIDIIIGTHKLLQEDTTFRDFGLLIIDEEHRFGVRQKEKLKSLRAEVDILTLTATPIPRTLNMAMANMRDLSIIATPPARRLAVKTFVREADSILIKEAILRELLRGGQVYYLHNEVKTIEKVASDLQEMLPEARVAIGHGQMRERELEQVMQDFYHKRHNVLVCTTIIETGIDIPSANTIIIDRADKFGLAQLHQLRGRVGRSHHQAYAYLMTPSRRSMTADAVKRLEAIEQAGDLGMGFTLATHDMEIRGAGELLGDEQSGQIQTVGFTLYMEMLERAVDDIRHGRTPDPEKPLATHTDINLRLPALIPDDYIPDVHTRLVLYKRIASASNSATLRELQVEMIDRFGLLPNPVKYLFRVTEIKLLAQKLGIGRIDTGEKAGTIDFSTTPNVDPMKLVRMVQREPQRYRLQGASTLKYTTSMETVEQRLQITQNLLEELSLSA
ncbi:transcription-repair coupling factor [Kistimonas asteriae]|uniref:transcription-repair coupling factor n=1 Tax=Kistimonas asteriae TaxID=517724 RepID=UPI001BACEF58|nr:transcription-repair coupling factor [Kistimonas asteriae]